MRNKPIYVFMPAYNEEENVEEVVNKLKQLRQNLKIYVIDDGSKDKTSEKAWKAGARVIKHPINLGGGAALRTAFTFATLNDVEHMITLDGDGQHDPKEILSIIDAATNGADMVIGSRFLRKQELKMPLYRRIGIRFFSWIISQIVKRRITDATSCYRAYNMKMVKKIFSKLTENQYYGLETLIRLGQNEAKIVEVPITSKPRRKGKSKKGVIRYGYHLLRTIVKTFVSK